MTNKNKLKDMPREEAERLASEGKLIIMTNIQDFLEEEKKEFKKTIQERTMNEDNPQYVLGWNACRYLSNDFIFAHDQRLLAFLKERVEELTPDNFKCYCVGEDGCYANCPKSYKEALDDIITLLTK